MPVSMSNKFEGSDEDLAREVSHKRNFTGLPKSQLAQLKQEAVLLWNKLSASDDSTVEAVQKSIVKHAMSTLSRSAFNVDAFAAYQATAHSIRDRLMEQWNITQQNHTLRDPKRIYYLSLEFLLGRSLDNAMINLNLKQLYSDSIKPLGFLIDDIISEEKDAALGNGGLGRLAACYMDGLACLEYPAWGYGLRYTYGIFKQHINEGVQTEIPDFWLNFGNPWEVPRLDVAYEVRFYGECVRFTQPDGSVRWSWQGGEKVRAVAYDVPIPGFRNKTCLNIRLWSSKPLKSFDLASFNEGNYDKSVAEQQKAENITSVLYPNDNHMVGKELRLKQQYFFVCATLKDILRRFKKTNRPWSDFPDQVAIQLNDTHPTLGIVELQRRLVDLEGLHWDEAWDIVTKVYAFTNHTVLPEALETWPVPMMKNLLPRHMAIIFDINLYFLQNVERKYPNDRERMRRMSIIEEGTPQRVRMAHLAIVGSHTVNGVAQLHSELVKNDIFRDFSSFYGMEKFQNVTNGITPRRWLIQANPELSALITSKIGDSWQKNLNLLSNLKKFANDEKFQQEWAQIKQRNKKKLCALIQKQSGLQIDSDSLFDVQVKRIHEYKRQLMNILGVIHRYMELKRKSVQERELEVKRTVIFGGKAAPGYYAAKLVIQLINNVANVINKDPDTRPYLTLCFIVDYNVSLAEIIIPASDISQHISTAGTEASGTSNMKFVLNGGLIVGTVDGANVEIGEEIGKDNIFFFGALAHEVADIRYDQQYHQVKMNKKLQDVLNLISSGMFGGEYQLLIDSLTKGGDYYLLSHDFDSYLDALKKCDLEFKSKTWTRKSILATSQMGKFSSDRSVMEYAKRIWHCEPLE